jgi:MYXO-CTERM domain-containing protein
MEWLLVIAVVALLAVGAAFMVRRRRSGLPEGVLDPSVRSHAGRSASRGDYEAGLAEKGGPMKPGGW